MKYYKIIATTLFILFLTSFVTPAIAILPKTQTQYIFEASWTSSSNYWYVYVIQYGNNRAVLQLSEYSPELGTDIFNIEKTLTRSDSFHWGTKQTTLSVTFNYDSSPQTLNIDFWATEKPSRARGVKGDWLTAAGDAEISFLGNTLEADNAIIISWREPR